VSAVNAAMSNISYQGFLNWHGREELVVTLTDQMSLGEGPVASETGVVVFTVAPVNDLQTLQVPASQRLLEDGDVVIHGISVFDIDSFDEGFDGQYRVSLQVTDGFLSVATPSDVTYLRGGVGLLDWAVVMEGSLTALNEALSVVTYKAAPNFNTEMHTEAVTLAVVDLSDPAMEAREVIPIVVTSINDPPAIVAPPYQLLAISGFRLPDMDPGLDYSLTISLFNPHSAISVRNYQSIAFAVNTTYSGTFAKNLSFSGRPAALVEAMDSLQYLRVRSYAGGDTIMLHLDDMSGNQTQRESSFIEIFLNTSSQPPPPVIRSISPTHGLVSGDTPVEILLESPEVFAGAEGTQVYCQVGPSQLVPASTVNGSVMCTTPAAAKPGMVLVRVTDGNTSWSNAVQFFYDEAPTLLSVWPGHGPVQGGLLVTVTGSNFRPTVGLACVFGATHAPAFWVNESSIQCITPNASSVGAVLLRLTTNGQDRTSGVVFKYEAAIRLRGLSPALGQRSASHSITVTGSGFVRGRRFLCQVALASVPAVYVNPSTLTCDLPPPSGQLRQVQYRLVTSEGGQYLVDGQPRRVLNLLRGQTYWFITEGNRSAHAWVLSSLPEWGLQNGTEAGTEWWGGVTRNASTTVFSVPLDAPPALYIRNPFWEGSGSEVVIVVSDRVGSVDIRVGDHEGQSWSDNCLTFRFTGKECPSSPCVGMSSLIAGRVIHRYVHPLAPACGGTDSGYYAGTRAGLWLRRFAAAGVLLRPSPIIGPGVRLIERGHLRCPTSLGHRRRECRCQRERRTAASLGRPSRL
jgi:hypothetical protein